MFTFHRFFGALCIGCAMTQAEAWVDTGHMLVARIAEQQLDASARKQIESIIKVGADAKTDTIATSACWADDHKSKEDAHWHYTNFHFRRDGKPVTQKPLEENVVWAIEKLTNDLKAGNLTPEAKGKALRMLIHFVGDVHQPLHTMAEDTDLHPEGDRGGNLFEIAPINGWGDRPVKNLHIYWDLGAGEYRYIDRPLTPASDAYLSDWAKRLIAEFPKAKLKDIEQPSAEAWAKEGLAYQNPLYNLKQGEPVPGSYEEWARKVCRERVTMAGYRLATTLRAILKP